MQKTLHFMFCAANARLCEHCIRQFSVWLLIQLFTVALEGNDMDTRELNEAGLAGVIDHTLLKPTAASVDIIKLCSEAVAYNFAAVCINPCWVSLAAGQLAGSNVAVCAVIGFPLGATSTAAKAAEASLAVRDGAREVDMVINIGALLEGRTDVVMNDMQAVGEAARAQNPDAITKVIIETCYLNRAEKIHGVRFCRECLF